MVVNECLVTVQAEEEEEDGDVEVFRPRVSRPHQVEVVLVLGAGRFKEFDRDVYLGRI